jgi:phosphoribosylaminoimidazole-succinocarboxamide synthase
MSPAAEARHVGSGKVREIFEAGDDRLLLVASDRISAYDVVLPQAIPDKGRVLTGLSAHWFARTKQLCPNHMVSVAASDPPDVGAEDIEGRAMLCTKAEPLPVEFVVRGYLSGSGWREYRDTQRICGHRLPLGLQESAELPEPILTPATKATSGHDENITEKHAAEICGPEAYEQARAFALSIYELASGEVAARGVILADTKFEFGWADERVILIDEALTPDSSRFWPADLYERGGAQPSFDKQFVRDWLDSTGWDHTPPPPELPRNVVEATHARYIEAYERITERGFEDYLTEVAG